MKKILILILFLLFTIISIENVYSALCSPEFNSATPSSNKHLINGNATHLIGGCVSSGCPSGGGCSPQLFLQQRKEGASSYTTIVSGNAPLCSSYLTNNYTFSHNNQTDLRVCIKTYNLFEGLCIPLQAGQLCYSETSVDNIWLNNNTPYASNVEINSSCYEQGFSINYTYSDLDNDLENTLNRTIRWFKNEILQSSLENRTNLTTNEIAPYENWTGSIKVADSVFLTNTENFTNSSTITIKSCTAPNLTIVFPPDNYTQSQVINFNFTYLVNSLNTITNCSLNYSSEITNDTSITEDINQVFLKDLVIGNYNWSIVCFDDFYFNTTSNISLLNVIQPSLLDTSVLGFATFIKAQKSNLIYWIFGVILAIIILFLLFKDEDKTIYKKI